MASISEKYFDLNSPDERSVEENWIFHESRHTVVCRAAQENGACANGVSILTGTTKSRFSRIRSSVIPYPNGTKFTVELASTQGRPDFKF